MAAGDGSHGTKRKADCGSAPTWSQDPVVRRYQEFAHGYKEGEKPTLIDHLYVKMPWHKRAEKSVEQTLELPSGARAEHCVKVVGGTRSGKTAFHRALIRKHQPSRDKSGLNLPYAYVEISATPSPFSIDQGILRALGDPTWKNHRGPEVRLGRIQDVAGNVGLLAIGVDDLHHLVDSRGERVQHAAADRLKEIGFHLRVPFVFSGLHRMLKMFETNEQENGRTEAEIEFHRFEWRKHKALFGDLVMMFNDEFKKKFGGSELDHNDDEDLFRLYVSTGGLVGQLARVTRVAAADCARMKSGLTKVILRKAILRVVAPSAWWPNGIDPFHEDFTVIVSDETLAVASTIGAGSGPPAASRKRQRGARS